MPITLLAVLGSIIIIGLASYAGFLLIKLKKQKQLIQIAKQQAIDKRNGNIFDNVRTLCMAGIEQQCDLSEIVIRVYSMLEYVQGESRINFEKDYPKILELYLVVKDMARGEAREALTKQNRMQEKVTRLKAEARLTESVIAELKQLKNNVSSLNNQINIEQV